VKRATNEWNTTKLGHYWEGRTKKRNNSGRCAKDNKGVGKQKGKTVKTYNSGAVKGV